MEQSIIHKVEEECTQEHQGKSSSFLWDWLGATCKRVLESHTGLRLTKKR